MHASRVRRGGSSIALPGRIRHAFTLAAIAAAALAAGAARADEAGPARDADAVEIERLQREIEAQKRTLEVQLDTLDAQRRAIEQQSGLLERQEQALEALQARKAGSDSGTRPAAAAEAEEPGAALPHVAQGPAPKPPVAPRPLPPEPGPQPPAPEEEEEAAAEAQEAEAVEPTPEAAAAAEAAGSEPGAEPAQEPPPGEARTAGGLDAEERPRSERPLEQLLIETGSVLLPQGVAQAEWSSEYTHATNDNVTINGFSIFDAIIIGTISVDKVDRDIFVNALNARIGLFDRLQLNGRFPVVYRRDDQLFGVGSPSRVELVTDNFNIGDVEAGLSWQAILGRGMWPSVIATTSWRFPTGEDPFGIPPRTVRPAGQPGDVDRVGPSKPATGSGFAGTTNGFNALWRTDPVVFFLGSNYTHNFQDDKGRFGDIDPGNSLETFLGLNVSLSERVGLSFSFLDSYTFETRVNSSKTVGSSFNDGRLVLGTSIGVNPRTSLIFASAIGVTDDAPDFQFSLRVPFTFALPFDLPEVPYLD
jgi:hypothetical protein